MIRNIKFGIKISTSNFDFLPEIYENRDLIDFIEVIIFPDFKIEDIEVIRNFKIPYSIHLPNSNYGIDFGDLNRNENNTKIINRVNQFNMYFKKLNPICYIVHPESSNIALSIKNLKKLKIAPIAIENMPVKGIHGEKLLGYSPKTLSNYFKNMKNLEFCLDINHAIKAAISLKKNYLNFIKEFLKFRRSPKIFHISGGNLNIEIDEHLALDIGQYNLYEIKKILFDFKRHVNLTFETPRNFENKIEDDLKNMKVFLKS